MRNSSSIDAKSLEPDVTAQDSSSPKLDGRDLMPLRTALGYLPGIKPRVAADALVYAHYKLMEERIRLEREFLEQNPLSEAGPDLSGVTVDFQGHSLSREDFDELVVTNDFGTRCVTPKGVLLLIKLYQAGAFERNTGKKGEVGEPHVELRTYAEMEAELLARAGARRQENAEWLAKRDAYVKDPASVPESEFSYSLLNAVFFEHCGAGSAKLEIGGITVSKMVARYVSNSGKSQDSTVVFRWTDKDGKPHELSKESRFVGNRRNDAERNWGLPE
jgi:hypothetical protein